MAPDTRVVLRRMRALLASAASWCQGAMAETRTGALVPTYHRDAVAFCLSGAAVRVARDCWQEDWREPSDAALVELARCLPPVPRFPGCLTLSDEADARVQRWNDAPVRTHLQVIELLDAALGEGGEHGAA